jgi:hypothetical protein
MQSPDTMSPGPPSVQQAFHHSPAQAPAPVSAYPPSPRFHKRGYAASPLHVAALVTTWVGKIHPHPRSNSPSPNRLQFPSPPVRLRHDRPPKRWTPRTLLNSLRHGYLHSPFIPTSHTDRIDRLCRVAANLCASWRIFHRHGCIRILRDIRRCLPFKDCSD